MKNPLRKRYPRELRHELGKYMVVFILMAAAIAFVCGFLVADSSVLIAYNESFEKYNIEDGNFRTEDEIYNPQREEIEKNGITLYENYYVEKEMDNGSVIRLFKNRETVNKVCLMEGELPEKTGEIAIDRMYADNNSLTVGDTLTSGKKSWKVTGLVALSDYSALFQDNNDTMFDSIKFGVAVVTAEEFETLNKNQVKYCYSWLYSKKPETEKEEKEMAEDLMEAIGEDVTLEEFIPQYQSQAIRFTGTDMGSDKAMVIVLLYIIIVIMAFVFGITTSNTIQKESAVIGTLRAMGYTRRELVRHYMAMPLLVTLIGALVGNIFGYTLLKNVFADMYYGSYSLPTYHTVWNAEAFFLTTVIPLFIMLLVNWLLLRHKLRLSPLKFLRRDIAGKKQKKAMRLSAKIGIFTRFRIRIIFQNLSNYIVLFVGIFFANLLLFFGLALPTALDHYQADIQENLLAKYQYMLSVPTTAMSGNKISSMLSLLEFSLSSKTDNEDAEEFSAYSLDTTDKDIKSEEIVLYGVKTNSRYIKVRLRKGDGVYISSSYADKFKIKVGDTITLKEKYENDTYTFEVSGIYDYAGAMCLFMNQQELNELFDLDSDYFSGYFSDTEITDINDKYIGSVVDLNALTKLSRQLDKSMGSMMNLLNVFAVGIFIVLIYLLSKIIIEKNAQSISMIKILGYNNGEVARLYILSTSIMVVIGTLLSIPLDEIVLREIFRIMMMEMTGWMELYVDPVIYAKIFGIGILTYAVVAVLEYRKIQKVPMDEALKNVE